MAVSVCLLVAVSRREGPHFDDHALFWSSVDVYDRYVYISILLCRNSLHLVVDEVYMRTILDPMATFTSVLELK